jgi:hypothetical protein
MLQIPCPTFVKFKNSGLMKYESHDIIFLKVFITFKVTAIPGKHRSQLVFGEQKGSRKAVKI